jgi:hypothetical protein
MSSVTEHSIEEHHAVDSGLLDSGLVEHYRCPEYYGTFAVNGLRSEHSGYFRFGPDVICYGRSSGGRAESHTHPLHDALRDVTVEGTGPELPFAPTDVVQNLRHERYTAHRSVGRLRSSSMIRRGYYFVRPLLATSVRKHLQRIWFRDWKTIRFPNWPVDTTVELMFEELMAVALKAHAVDRIPFIWFWPNGAQSCTIMTHDIETAAGRDFCDTLMELDDEHGIKSSFQVVPEGRYQTTDRFLASIRERGCEVNVHDLNHDGHLFTDRTQFLRRAERINQYGRKFAAAGFRSAVLYRNVDWLNSLDFAYDMSVPSTGHLEAQRGGCCSVRPFFIGDMVELPVTTMQDYSLFHILNQYSIDTWKRQLAIIGKKHGLASFIVHPDYVVPRRARDTYRRLLDHLEHLRSEGKWWFALPGAVNRWWRDRSKMTLVRRGTKWEVEGPNKEQARVAFASLDGNKVVYWLQSVFAVLTLRQTSAEAATVVEAAWVALEGLTLPWLMLLPAALSWNW